MRDLYHNVLVTQVLAPVVATATKTSSAIDMQGFNSLLVLFNIGLSGDTLSGSVKWTLKLQESDDNSSYSDVALADLFQLAASIVIDDPAEDETVIAFGYRGAKRYVKAVATPTGTHTNGTPMGMSAVRGTPSLAPTL